MARCGHAKSRVPTEGLKPGGENPGLDFYGAAGHMGRRCGRRLQVRLGRVIKGCQSTEPAIFLQKPGPG